MVNHYSAIVHCRDHLGVKKTALKAFPLPLAIIYSILTMLFLLKISVSLIKSTTKWFASIW